ncbi:MAG: RlmE family RNA methyltransferase [Desulfobacterales bacterium]|nr:MAG: RlmE family RNA methyltransferase [Desulfobacterales bacterium]
MYAQVKSNPWNDYYARRARQEQYPARSVYKLEEIQKRFGVLKKGSRILDLGCCPGSWLLFASKIVGDSGLVLGVDISPLPIRLPPNARFIQQDVLAWDESFLEAIGANFQTVLSDMAPSTTGSKFVDSQRSLQLSESALAISTRALRPGGAFVCKIFHGFDLKRFSDRLRKSFTRVSHFKPKSSRKPSKEVYIVGRGKKAEKI